MKTVSVKYFYLSILICAFVLYFLISVHAAQTISGVKRLEDGIAAYENGEYDNAVFKLEMAVYQIPENEKDQLWDACFYLGLSYHLTGDNEESTKQFLKAQEITKNKVPDSYTHSPKIVELFKDVKKVKTSITTKTKFRSTPKENFSRESVKAMLKAKGFYDSDWNKSASGFHNDYTLQNGGNVVYDRASGLMWQQSGSYDRMEYENASAYVTKLNSKRFAGYKDWRLPTLEEAMSLMETSEKNGDLYIDPVFDSKQRWIWTSDLKSASVAWVVYFGNGYCDNSGIGYYSYCVRAVR